MKFNFIHLACLVFIVSSGPTMAEDQVETSASELAFLMESNYRSAEESKAPMLSARIIRLSAGSNASKMKGEWLYSQGQREDEDKPAHQQLIRLLPIDDKSVVQKSYRPKDLSKWQNAWDNVETLQEFGRDDIEPSFDNSCDQVWVKQRENEWLGKVDLSDCTIEADDANPLKSRQTIVNLAGLVVSGLKEGEISLVRLHNSSTSLLRYSSPNDWRQPEPENLMLLELDNGEVLFELSPSFAPKHVKNIRKLVSQGYFDGLHVVRSQDNYVAQWGDANAGTDNQRAIKNAEAKLPLEFFRDNNDVGFFKIDSRDPYAEQTGFAEGMPVSSDGSIAWMTHCYGMLGVGRGGEADSGNGSSLYMVNGHAPRHLDRNVTLVGRAISGMGALSSLPRGTGPLGFYESEEEYVRINKVTIGTELAADKLNIEIFRTDTRAFEKFVALRTTRNESWFLHPTGKIEVCNVNVPTRVRN